jgi:hypothetical protein
MHVFQVKGLSGMLMLVLALLTGIFLFLALPSAFMMVLWNALIYEVFRGSEINLYQGFLLWGMMLLTLKLIFSPELKFQLMRQHPDLPQTPPPSPNGKERDRDSD